MFQCCCAEDSGEVPAIIDAETMMESQLPQPTKQTEDTEHMPQPKKEEPEQEAQPEVQAPSEAPALPEAPVEVTAQNDVAPAEDGNVFTVMFTRDNVDQPLGLQADFADENIHIADLVRGDTVVARYNATAKRPIAAGHYIKDINGVKAGSAETPNVKMTDLLRNQLMNMKSLELLVSRPYIFDCAVSWKGHAGLGVSLAYSDSGNSLVIKGVYEGVMKKATPKVEQGDRIVAVGGVRGGPQELLAAIRETHEAVFQISRPH